MAEKVDYQAAAIAALSKAEADGVVESDTPAPEAEAKAEETPAPEAEAKAEETPAPEAKKEAAPPPTPKKSLVEIAKEKSAARAAKAREEETTQKLARAQALLDAAERGDAMGLLTAAKIPWAKAAKQVIDGEVSPPEKKADPVSEVAELKKTVTELQQKLRQDAERTKRAEVIGFAKEIATKNGEKYALTVEHDAADEALKFVEQYWNETGELPGKDLEESLQMGLEAVEEHLGQQAARWEKALAKKKSGVTKSTTPDVTQVAESKQAAKTLTNATGAGARAAETTKKMKTEADYRREAERFVDIE